MSLCGTWAVIGIAMSIITLGPHPLLMIIPLLVRELYKLGKEMK